MGNIRNYNFNYLDLKLSNSDYWDMYLTKDDTNNGNCDGLLSGSCFVVWYNFNNPLVYSSTSIDSIYSLVTWTGATNTGYTFDTIGLTGIDNGLVIFDKQSGDTTNLALLSALTGTTLVVPSGDTRLFMTRVTGTTGNYIYPMEKKNNGTFDYINFDGGFYQGFYKMDGYTYQVLPVRVEESWSAEFWLKTGREPITGVTGSTINEINTNNNGFFFYMGTRAENKFWNQWSGDCTSGCVTTTACTATTFCTIPRETNISILGDYGFGIPLDPPGIQISLITNEFLIYGRTGTHSAFGTGAVCCTTCKRSDGLCTETVCSYSGGGIPHFTINSVVTNHSSPFLIYGRAGTHSAFGTGAICCTTYKQSDGMARENVCTFTGFTTPQTQLDYKADIVDNALGFRIKDDGSIGYRLLTYTASCIGNNYDFSGRTAISGITIEENYSLPNMIPPNQWTYVVIKFVTDFKTECELKQAHPRKGKLLFYVNAKLKYVVEDFDEFIARRLNEYKDKQIGVPFNFSLGGGSQGLLESQTFGGRDPHDFNLDIQQHFAGSFIGGIADFRYNVCDLSYCDIINNFLDNAATYSATVISHGFCK